ncbi:hypothetical protein GOP47_0028577 [Adiantum capillus-veneris]|nr:hypothetical protein GOP47_0028577 [Adiantum capillus-veneris]
MLYLICFTVRPSRNDTDAPPSTDSTKCGLFALIRFAIALSSRPYNLTQCSSKAMRNRLESAVPWTLLFSNLSKDSAPCSGVRQSGVELF